MGIFNTIFGRKNNEKLATILKDGAFLVDVRSKAEFEDGHVKGSTNIPLDQVAQHLSKFKGKDQIVVFCRSGSRSSMAQSILEQNGFTNVTNGGTWKDIDALLTKKIV